METLLRDFLLCAHHRPVIMELSAMVRDYFLQPTPILFVSSQMLLNFSKQQIQAITLRCPGALVWCGLAGEKRDTITQLAGGPLEYMPVLPSQLPMPSNNRRHNEQIRRRLRKIEYEIDERSKHSERRWVAEKWQRRTIESTMSEVIINTLGVLDGHCFDRSDSSSYSLQTLYAKLFAPIDKVVKQETVDNGKVKETQISYRARVDEPIVKVLCEWAVSHQRFGEHRAMVVAWLMEKRQADIIAFDTQSSLEEAAIPAMYNGLPVFQRNLMEFLDFEAPILEDNCTDQER